MRLTVHRTRRRPWSGMRDHRQPLVKTAGLTVVGAGAGAVTEYLLDPDRGRARRARLRDKTTHAAHEMNDGLGDISRDFSNRGRGVAAAARYRVTGRSADDAILHDRVRAELGRHVSHPHAIQVRVDDRTVMLTGDVLAGEDRRAYRAIKHIPGVKDVGTRWRVYDEPGDVPTLQRHARPPKPKPELLQQQWSPTARVLASLGALATWPLTQRLPASMRWTLRGASSVLATRALTNRPLHRLTGPHASHAT